MESSIVYFFFCDDQDANNFLVYNLLVYTKLNSWVLSSVTDMQQAETARDLICDLLANNCTICQKKVPVVKETQPKKIDSKAKNRQSLSPKI